MNSLLIAILLFQTPLAQQPKQAHAEPVPPVKTVVLSPKVAQGLREIE